MSRYIRRQEIPAEKLERYERLIRERPHMERRGVGLPYTSVNGHMFTFLSAEGTLGLRLPAAEREAFLREHASSLFVAHGAVLKEYVVVPEALFHDTGRLLGYLDISYGYAAGLKPKRPPRSRSKDRASGKGRVGGTRPSRRRTKR